MDNPDYKEFPGLSPVKMEGVVALTKESISQALIDFGITAVTFESSFNQTGVVIVQAGGKINEEVIKFVSKYYPKEVLKAKGMTTTATKMPIAILDMSNVTDVAIWELMDPNIRKMLDGMLLAGYEIVLFSNKGWSTLLKLSTILTAGGRKEPFVELDASRLLNLADLETRFKIIKEIKSTIIWAKMRANDPEKKVGADAKLLINVNLSDRNLLAQALVNLIELLNSPDLNNPEA